MHIYVTFKVLVLIPVVPNFLQTAQEKRIRRNDQTLPVLQLLWRISILDRWQRENFPDYSANSRQCGDYAAKIPGAKFSPAFFLRVIIYFCLLCLPLSKMNSGFSKWWWGWVGRDFTVENTHSKGKNCPLRYIRWRQWSNAF